MASGYALENRMGNQGTKVIKIASRPAYHWVW